MKKVYEFHQSLWLIDMINHLIIIGIAQDKYY